jgi:hypothetical protein
MADITANLDAWSSTEGSNSPSGSTTIGTGLDDNLRAVQAGAVLWVERFPHIHNLCLEAAVGSNALTITLSGNDAADPSSTNKVRVPFRSVTAATGTFSQIVVSAATTLTISSGSTLGATDATAFRLWIVAFNDGGTLRLGAINCLSGTSIYPLAGWGIASSTAEGGAGAADSAQVFYTGSAVTSKAYTVLGYMTWETGLTTAGTWDAVPTRIQLFGPDVRLPGEVVQIAENYDAALATGTTDLPQDDSIPQNTEGDEYIDQAITPTSAANKLEIEHQGSYSHSGTLGQIGVALFQDSTANALAATLMGRDASAGSSGIAVLNHSMRSGTTSATTFKIRAGESTGTGGTVSFNGSGGTRLFGGVCSSFMRVREVMA